MKALFISEVHSIFFGCFSIIIFFFSTFPLFVCLFHFILVLNFPCVGPWWIFFLYVSWKNWGCWTIKMLSDSSAFLSPSGGSVTLLFRIVRISPKRKDSKNSDINVRRVIMICRYIKTIKNQTWKPLLVAFIILSSSNWLFIFPSFQQFCINLALVTYTLKHSERKASLYYIEIRLLYIVLT